MTKPKSKSKDPVLYLLVSIANCIICLVHHGTLTCAPLIYLALQEWFSVDHLLLLSVCGLHYGTTYIGYAIWLQTCHILPARYFTPLGCILLSGGLISSAYVPNIWWTFLTYGTVAGFGNSLLQIPTNFNMLQNGDVGNVLGPVLSTSGFIIGVIAMPLAVGYFIVYYNYRGGMLMFGGVALHGFIAAVIYWPLRGYLAPMKPKATTEHGDDTDTTDGGEANDTDKVDGNNNEPVFGKCIVDSNSRQTMRKATPTSPSRHSPTRSLQHGPPSPLKHSPAQSLHDRTSPSKRSFTQHVEHNPTSSSKISLGQPLENDPGSPIGHPCSVKRFSSISNLTQTSRSTNDVMLSSFDSDIEFNRSVSICPSEQLSYNPLRGSNLSELEKSLSEIDSSVCTDVSSNYRASLDAMYSTRRNLPKNLHTSLENKHGNILESFIGNSEPSIFVNVKSKLKRILKKREYVVSLSKSEISDHGWGTQECFNEPEIFATKSVKHRGISTESEPQRYNSSQVSRTTSYKSTNAGKRDIGIHTTPPVPKIVILEATPSPTVQFQSPNTTNKQVEIRNSIHEFQEEETRENSRNEHIYATQALNKTPSSYPMKDIILNDHKCISHPFGVDAIDDQCDICMIQACNCDPTYDQSIHFSDSTTSTTIASCHIDHAHEYVNVASVLNERNPHSILQTLKLYTNDKESNDAKERLRHTATYDAIDPYIESFNTNGHDRQVNKIDVNEPDGGTDVNNNEVVNASLRGTADQCTHRIITVAESDVAIDTTSTCSTSSVSLYPSSSSTDSNIEEYAPSKSLSSSLRMRRQAPTSTSIPGHVTAPKRTVTFCESVDVTVMSPQCSSYFANLNDIGLTENHDEEESFGAEKKTIRVPFRFEVPGYNIVQIVRGIHHVFRLREKQKTDKQKENIGIHNGLKLGSLEKFHSDNDVNLPNGSDNQANEIVSSTTGTTTSNDVIQTESTDEVNNTFMNGSISNSLCHGLRNCKVECTNDDCSPPWSIRKNAWLQEKPSVKSPVQTLSKCPLRNYNEVICNMSNSDEINDLQQHDKEEYDDVDGKPDDNGNIGIIPSQELIERWCNIDLNSSDDTEHHCKKQEPVIRDEKLKCINRGDVLYDIEVDEGNDSEIDGSIGRSTSSCLKTWSFVLYIMSTALYFSSYITIVLLYPNLVTDGMTDPLHVAHGLLLLGSGEILGRAMMGSCSKLTSHHKAISQFIGTFLSSLLTLAWTYIEDLLSFMLLFGFLSAIIKHGHIGILAHSKSRNVISELSVCFTLVGVCIPCITGATGYILSFTYLRLGFIIHSGLLALATILLLLSICTWTEKY